jgi:hypothetical protein
MVIIVDFHAMKEEARKVGMLTLLPSSSLFFCVPQEKEQ